MDRGLNQTPMGCGWLLAGVHQGILEVAEAARGLTLDPLCVDSSLPSRGLLGPLVCLPPAMSSSREGHFSSGLALGKAQKGLQ